MSLQQYSRYKTPILPPNFHLYNQNTFVTSRFGQLRQSLDRGPKRCGKECEVRNFNVHYFCPATAMAQAYVLRVSEAVLNVTIKSSESNPRNQSSLSKSPPPLTISHITLRGLIVGCGQMQATLHIGMIKPQLQAWRLNTSIYIHSRPALILSKCWGGF